MFSGQLGFALSERQKKSNLSKFDKEVVLAYEKCYVFTDGFFACFITQKVVILFFIALIHIFGHQNM